MDEYYSFVFRGLLTEEALDRAGRKSKPIFSDEEEAKVSERLCIDLMDENFVQPAKKMAIVYTAICTFENSLREFITKKLLEQFGENWWTKGVSDNVRKYAENRKKEEENAKWHSQRGEQLINYTDFGHLISIMTKNWALFEPHIRDLEWARQILMTLQRSRNVIMHSGELEPADIERIGTNIRDWLRQTGL